tara:strand:- start:115 stop:2082 length:1968 start_codon:yes stop_codon:yes gene_type:complete
MKRILSIASIVIFSLSLNSQNLLTKSEIENLPENQRLLYERIESENNSRNSEISKFLNKNKNAKRVFKGINGNTYVLYKIIEGKPIYRTTDNSKAAIATKTNELHSGGSLGIDLDGSGLTVGVWDAGPVQISHAEFQNADNSASRVTNIENVSTEGGTDPDDHATHVTGTIAAKGVNAQAKGMAPGISVITHNFNDDTVEIVSVLNNTLIDMFLSNHSYGIPIEQDSGNLDAWMIGAYTADARGIDDILRENPNYLMVTSAGNSGEVSYAGGLFGGFDKLTSKATAKNNLVVANADPQINPFSNEVTSLLINTSSSQGPSDDLRIKPDIAGDGTGLFSPTPTDGYSTFSGTSMSSPNVTGSLALLQQYYNQLNGTYMKAATLKGLACHTTTDDDSNAGPDPLFGWGLLNTKVAAETILKNTNGSAIINEITLNNSETYSYSFTAQAGEKLSATICWTDVRGVVVASSETPNNQTPVLVNDLDLRLMKDGTTFFPWKLNFSPTTGFSNTKDDNIVDNVERIDIEVPEAGVYQLTVSHKGTLKVPGPFQTPPLTQDFSLVVTGANLTLSNLDFEKNSLNIWPNPANNLINYKFKSFDGAKATITLFDVRGRKVFTTIRTDSSQFIEGQIPTNNLEKGIYFLNLKQSNATFDKKIIIQ